MAETPRTGFARSRLAALAALAAVLGVAILLAFTLIPTPAPIPTPTATSAATPTATSGPVIGDTIGLADGALARLNSVESGVHLDPGLPGPEPGMRLDRLDVEICAGREDLFVDAAFWNGLGRDQRVHSAHMGVRMFFTLTMAPGSCQRGPVDLAVPEGVELEAVLLLDTELTTAARWSLDGRTDATGPLVPAVLPHAVAVGSTVQLIVGGATTVHTVDLGAGLTPGSVSMDAELCAGDQPIPASPRHWFLQLADHHLVAAVPQGGTMPTGTIAAQACDRGTIDFAIPAGPPPVGVIYAYGGQFEQARWVMDR